MKNRIGFVSFFFSLFTLVSLAQSSVSMTSIAFPSRDALTITADLYVAQNDFPYVLLCHQDGFSRGEYKTIVDKINKLGFNCIAIDQRSGNDVNGITNETADRARVKKLPVEPLDAEQDIVAAIDYTFGISNKKVIVVGSMYSASLALKIAAYNTKVKAVAAFSAGDNCGEKLKLNKAVETLNKPVFITCSGTEATATKELITHIPSKNIVSFFPDSEGNQGAKALWKKEPESKKYWRAFKKFLLSVK